jgi:hypothetical protein
MQNLDTQGYTTTTPLHPFHERLIGRHRENPDDGQRNHDACNFDIAQYTKSTLEILALL